MRREAVPSRAAGVRSSGALRAAPILDVERGVVAGYHCGDTDGSAARLRGALSLVASLPPNTFLSVALRWADLADPAMRSELLRPASLHRVVIDVSGLLPSSPAGPAEHTIAGIRDAGGLVALPAADLWKPGFVWWMRLRPSMIVLDAEWTRGIGAASRRQLAVDAVGRIAGHADAWLVASHVGSGEDFDELAELRVPLARGDFVGRSAELGSDVNWPRLSPDVLRALRPLRLIEPGPLRDALEPVEVADSLIDARAILRRDPAGRVVLADMQGRPMWLAMLSADGELQRRELLRVNVDTPTEDAVPRALARPEPHRADPIAAVDNAGRLLGLVSMSRLIAVPNAPQDQSATDLYAAWSTIVDALP